MTDQTSSQKSPPEPKFPDLPLNHATLELSETTLPEQKENPADLDQEIIVLEAENEKRFLEQLDDLEHKGSQPELEHFFVTDVLAGPGTYEKVRQLHERQLLQKILPEMSDAAKMPLSNRLYPRKNALDQSLLVLKKLDERLAPDHYYFQNPRSSERLIKLASLLNRAGMHTDQNLGGGGLKKWHNGQPVYNGYEQMSGLAMRRAMQRFNESGQLISGASFFSEADLDFGGNLAAQHNQLRFKLSRQSRYPWPKDVTKRIKDWTEVVYDTDALNHRLDFADTTEAHFLLQMAEIEGLKNTPFKKDLLDRAAHFNTQLNSELPYFERRMLKRTIHPFIDGHDLEMLGLTDRLEKDNFIEYVIDGQLDETLTTRQQALTQVINIVQEKMGQELQEETVQKLMDHKRRFGYRMENMETVADKRGDGYHVRYFQTKPVRQFPKTISSEVIKTTLESGNYPDLESYFQDKSGQQSPEAIIQRLLNVGFSNLDQIEGIIRRDPDISLDEIQQAAAPLSRHVEVYRDDGQKVILENGYQAREHKGEGRLHINHQRYQDLMNYFRRKNKKGEFMETEEEAVHRFFEDGLIPAAGNPLVEIINARKHDQGSTIAFQKIKSSDKPQFCGVILVGQSPYYKNIVTSIFSRSDKEFRDTMRFYVKKIFQTEDIPEDSKKAQLQQANFALKRIGLNELSLSNVQPSKEELDEEQLVKREASAELLVTFDDLKSRGFGQKEIGRIIGFFQEQRREGHVSDRERALEMLRDFRPGQAGLSIQSLKEKKKK